MALESFKERARESAQSIASRVQESTAWIQLAEKFASLTPGVQKLVFVIAGVVVTLILFAIPSPFYFSSQDSLSQYEDKSHLVREMFRAFRAASGLPVPPPVITAGQLATSARTALSPLKLVAEQIQSVDESQNFALPGVPKSIQQVGLTVTLQKLNVTQMIDAGHALQGIHPLMKMIGIDVRASQENNHLFDVIYRLAAFSGKPEPVAPTKGPNGKKLGGKAK